MNSDLEEDNVNKILLRLISSDVKLDILRQESFIDDPENDLFNYVIVYRHKYLTDNEPNETVRIEGEPSKQVARIKAKWEVIKGCSFDTHDCNHWPQ
jgi:hypothetical protein